MGTIIRLFSCPGAALSEAPRAEFVTPLGELKLDVSTGAASLRTSRHSAAHVLADGSTVGMWQLPGLAVEVWIGHFLPQLPPGFEVAGCVGAIIRLLVLEDTEGCVVSCGWSPAAAWTDCDGPANGEWLDSVSWHDQHVKVALGTEGGDALADHSAADHGLPQRLTRSRRSSLATCEDASTTDFLDLVESDDHRLVVRLPPQRLGERYQLQFVCAWAAYTEHEIATWYAVEQSAKTILAGRCAPIIIDA